MLSSARREDSLTDEGRAEEGEDTMKLSKVTRYGLRALFDLCLLGEADGEKPVAVGGIARRQDIPLNYLEQLFVRLRRGNLVRSVRGARGGYVLARPPGEISVAEVVRALGEPIAFGDCQTDAGCRNASRCPTYGLWRRLKTSVDDILENTPLEDLAQEHRENRAGADREDFFRDLPARGETVEETLGD
jgi:Rrf2 family protein